MRQISRLSVTAVSTALLITLSSCSSTQSTLEADDQPSTPIENREMTSDVQENKANGAILRRDLSPMPQTLK